MRFLALERGCRDKNFRVSHIFLGQFGHCAKNDTNWHMAKLGQIWKQNFCKNKPDFTTKFQNFISNSYRVIISQSIKKFSEDVIALWEKYIVKIKL